MKRLILIEGIPGSGKSTVAARVRDHYAEGSQKVAMFTEGDLHPVDLAWCAWLRAGEYEGLLDRFPEHAGLLKANSEVTGTDAAVAYTRLGLNPNESELLQYLSDREVFQGRVSPDEFRDIHLQRWSSFAERADENTVYVFECVYFQNHITELLGTYDIPDGDIVPYMIDLLRTVASLNPVIVYLDQADTAMTIGRVAAERVSDDTEQFPDWIEMVIEYVQGFPHARRLGLAGLDGTVSFLEHRKQIERTCMGILEEKVPGVTCGIVDNSDYNLERAVANVLRILRTASFDPPQTDRGNPLTRPCRLALDAV